MTTNKIVCKTTIVHVLNASEFYKITMNLTKSHDT